MIELGESAIFAATIFVSLRHQLLGTRSITVMFFAPRCIVIYAFQTNYPGILHRHCVTFIMAANPLCVNKGANHEGSTPASI